jgi:hypothetical protein
VTVTERLATGAEARLRNVDAPLAVVLVNGGSARAVPGTWSATSELLAVELAPRFPEIAFVEVRYRIKTWNELDLCKADAHAALDLVERPALLVGFSMGGAVSIAVADHASAVGVLGLAPWIPDRLSLQGLVGKRLDVLHGSWDRYLPGIPGVSASSSKRGFDRARALGIDGTYALIDRGLHGAALRRRSGAIVRLPRAEAWIDRVGERVAVFQDQASLRRSR